MTLFKLKYFLRLLFAFIKKYWKIFSIFFIIIAVYLFSKRKTDELKRLLEIQKNQSEKEIDTIRKSHKKEISKIILEQKKKEILLKKIEQEYKKKNKALDKKVKKEIEEIISETKEDPDVITKRISKITGFKIHDDN